MRHHDLLTPIVAPELATAARHLRQTARENRDQRETIERLKGLIERYRELGDPDYQLLHPYTGRRDWMLHDAYAMGVLAEINLRGAA